MAKTEEAALDFLIRKWEANFCCVFKQKLSEEDFIFHLTKRFSW